MNDVLFINMLTFWLILLLIVKERRRINLIESYINENFAYSATTTGVDETGTQRRFKYRGVVVSELELVKNNENETSN